MDTAVEVKNDGLGPDTADPYRKAIREGWRMVLLLAPLIGASSFAYAFFAWPWKEQEALAGINLVELILDLEFQSNFQIMCVVMFCTLIAYGLSRDKKWLSFRLKPEGEANLAARLLLIALASPFLGAAALVVLPIVFCLVYVFALWMGAGQLADSLALLPGHGYKALKQVLWLVNLCLLHGVLGMLLAWMGTNSRHKWQLGLKQKSLNLACLGMFLVLYWQLSKHYGVGFSDFFEIYLYDPEVTMGAIGLSLLFLAFSTIVVAFLSMRPMSSSFRNIEQIAVMTLPARSGQSMSEKETKLLVKVVYQLLIWMTVLYSVYLLGRSYL